MGDRKPSLYDYGHPTSEKKWPPAASCAFVIVASIGLWAMIIGAVAWVGHLIKAAHLVALN